MSLKNAGERAKAADKRAEEALKEKALMAEENEILMRYVRKLEAAAQVASGSNVTWTYQISLFFPLLFLVNLIWMSNIICFFHVAYVFKFFFSIDVVSFTVLVVGKDYNSYSRSQRIEGQMLSIYEASQKTLIKSTRCQILIKENDLFFEQWGIPKEYLR